MPPIWTEEMALSAYNQRTKGDLAIYLHGCAGYPVIETWIESIQAGRYATWPKLNKFKAEKTTQQDNSITLCLLFIFLSRCCSVQTRNAEKDAHWCSTIATEIK